MKELESQVDELSKQSQHKPEPASNSEPASGKPNTLPPNSAKPQPQQEASSGEFHENLFGTSVRVNKVNAAHEESEAVEEQKEAPKDIE